MLQQYSSRAVAGDGNCLYRALSLALFGTEDYYGYLGVRTAIELVSNASAYTSESSSFVLGDLPICTPAYRELVRLTLTNGTYSEMIHVFAFSKAFGIDIQSYCCPDLASSYQYPHPYTIHVRRWSYTKTFRGGCVTLMWTISKHSDTEPNHFSILVPYHLVTGLTPPESTTRLRPRHRRLNALTLRTPTSLNLWIPRLQSKTSTSQSCQATKRDACSLSTVTYSLRTKITKEKGIRHTNWVTPFAILLYKFQESGFVRYVTNTLVS